MKRERLTKRQRAMLDLIVRHQRANLPPPTIREMQQEANISSTSVAHHNVKRLEEMGYIERQAGAVRGVRALRDASGQPLTGSPERIARQLYRLEAQIAHAYRTAFPNEAWVDAEQGLARLLGETKGSTR